MNERRAIIGLCMLCALLASAFAAQGASAVGTTAYTCVKGGTGTTYNTPHCRPTDGAGEYSHKSIANGTTTELSGNNKDHTGAVIPGTLVATLFGTTVELKWETVTVSGSMTNSEEGGEMIASGTAAITFSNVSVVKPSPCQVATHIPPSGTGATGAIDTEPLTLTTQGQGHRWKLHPVTPPVLARFWLEGALCPLKDTTFTVSGSITGVPSGPTANFTEADTTAQNTLKLNGAKAGVSGSVTIEGRANSGDTFRPLSVTT